MKSEKGKEGCRIDQNGSTLEFAGVDGAVQDTSIESSSSRIDVPCRDEVVPDSLDLISRRCAAISSSLSANCLFNSAMSSTNVDLGPENCRSTVSST